MSNARRMFLAAGAITVAVLPGSTGSDGLLQTAARLEAVERTQITQLPSTPPRDRMPPRQVGTGAISGRVVDAVTGQPIARARVRLQSPAGPRPPMTTDGDGRFSFTELPAGPWFLMVERTTYQPTRYPEPGRSLRSSLRGPMLLEGQTLDNVVVPMHRGGVIAGRVSDDHGDPVEHAEIRLLRLPRSGTGTPAMGGGGSTNDIGEFRLARIEPGAYVLMALPRGRQADENDETQPVPTFYPGVLAMSQAQPIVIQRGQSVLGLEMVMLAGVGALVRGTVAGIESGSFGGGFVNARTVADETFGSWSLGGANVRPDGTFQLRLPPGEYVLETHVMPRTAGGPPQQEDGQFGNARIAVTSGETADVTIVVGPPAAVSGRFIFEDGSSPLPDPKQVRLFLRNQEGAPCRSGRFELAADWTFTITGVTGTCIPNFGGAGAWTMKAFVAHDEDWLDRPMTFEPAQQLRGVRAVLTDRRTELALHVSDETGQSTREYVALVFTTQKERWKLGRAGSGRYVRTFVPPPAEHLAIAARMPQPPPAMLAAAAQGHGTLTGLPPGEYFVVALEDLDPEDSREPAVLERLVHQAVRVILTEGVRAEAHVQRLKKP